MPLWEIEERYPQYFGVEAVPPPLAASRRLRAAGIPFRAEFVYGRR